MSGLSGMVFSAKRGRLLKTGQTTQYGSEQDDGALERGLSRAYEVLTTGAYAGTANIDLSHYAGGAGAIAFDDVAKTITDTGNGLALFKTNDVITTTDPDNPGPFTVTTGNVAGTITCAGATFVTGTPAGAVTIKKREAHSNACVRDLRTGLMWSRTTSSKMGAASNGLMPWTGQLYDIFAYVAAANAAAVGGRADWRVPNLIEALSLCIIEVAPGADGYPDTTAFPVWPTSIHTSTHCTDGASVYILQHDAGPSARGNFWAEATGSPCALVAG